MTSVCAVSAVLARQSMVTSVVHVPASASVEDAPAQVARTTTSDIPRETRRTGHAVEVPWLVTQQTFLASSAPSP